MCDCTTTRRGALFTGASTYPTSLALLQVECNEEQKQLEVDEAGQ